MCTKNSFRFCFASALAFLIVSCVGGQSDKPDKTNFDIPEYKVLNGTWILSPQLPKNAYFAEMKFSWGVGKSLGDTGSIDIDLAERKISVPGEGLWTIEDVSKSDKADLRVTTVFVGSNEDADQDKFRIIWDFVVVSDVELRISSQSFNGSLDEPYLKGATRWYRLSGPAKSSQ